MTEEIKSSPWYEVLKIIPKARGCYAAVVLRYRAMHRYYHPSKPTGDGIDKTIEII